MYVEKTHTWADNWNDIIRTVFYKDDKLKELLMVPDGTSIVNFIDKYFINSAATDELLVDERVRVVYSDDIGGNTGNKNVRRKLKEFDIYVREDVLHNATNDRLQSRTKLIAERIKYLLLRDYHVCRMHFEYYDDYDLWTKMVGYTRYHIAFTYKISI